METSVKCSVLIEEDRGLGPSIVAVFMSEDRARARLKSESNCYLEESLIETL